MLNCKPPSSAFIAMSNRFVVATLLVGHSLAAAEPIQPEVTWQAVNGNDQSLHGRYDIDVMLTDSGGVVYQERFDDVVVNDGLFTIQLGVNAELDKDATGTLTVVVGHINQEPIEDFSAANPPTLMGKDTGLEVRGLIGAPGTPRTGGLGGLGATQPQGEAQGNDAETRPFDARNGRMSIAGEVIADGPVDNDSVEPVVKRKMNQLRYCFQREARRQPDLSGTMTVAFTIELDGTVSNVRSEPGATVNNDTAVSCVHGRFEHMQFAEPDGATVQVRIPLEYVP